MILRHVQHPHEVGVRAVEDSKTSCKISQKPKTKNEDIERTRRSPLRDLPEWLEEFSDNSVDEKASATGEAPASIFREPLHQGRSIKVVSDKHRIFIHSPKDRNCRVCKKTESTRAPCRKRTGNQVRRAEKFGDLITADHKVLN